MPKKAKEVAKKEAKKEPKVDLDAENHPVTERYGHKLEGKKYGGAE